MAMVFKYTARSIQDLKRLDSIIAKRILTILDRYAILANPLSRAKPLSGSLSGLYRFRIGDYRVICERGKDGQVHILFVLRIRHRKEIYQ